VRTPLGETVQEFIGEIAVWAVICLVGGVFIFMWGRHPALPIVGIVMFAIVGGWFGYLHRKFIDSQSSTGRRLQAALTTAVLAGLCAFAVSLVFCSCP
jgi:uncharacterized membrane-anchored protein